MWISLLLQNLLLHHQIRNLLIPGTSRQFNPISDNKLRKWPVIPITLLINKKEIVKADINSIYNSWTQGVDLLQRFRQGNGIGRKSWF